MNNCNYCNNEYPGCFPGVIKNMNKAACPHRCIIPALTVETADGIKNVAGCFVHVLSTNTTYYIDDKSRITKIWAGPVEYNDYDYQTNPLGLRSQEVWDFLNNRVIRYNKVGEYRLTTLEEV